MSTNSQAESVPQRVSVIMMSGMRMPISPAAFEEGVWTRYKPTFSEGDLDSLQAYHFENSIILRSNDPEPVFIAGSKASFLNFFQETLKHWGYGIHPVSARKDPAPGDGVLFEQAGPHQVRSFVDNALPTIEEP